MSQGSHESVGKYVNMDPDLLKEDEDVTTSVVVNFAFSYLVGTMVLFYGTGLLRAENVLSQSPTLRSS